MEALTDYAKRPKICQESPCFCALPPGLQPDTQDGYGLEVIHYYLMTVSDAMHGLSPD